MKTNFRCILEKMRDEFSFALSDVSLETAYFDEMMQTTEDSR